MRPWCGGLPPGRMQAEPEGGWKPWTYYVVEVSWRATNPIYRLVLYVGAPSRVSGRPLAGSYTSLLKAIDETHQSDPELTYFLQPVCEIPELKP